MVSEAFLSIDGGERTVPARSAARLRAHFDIERELASRLREASPGERRVLYGAVYDELFRRVPDHPQLMKRTSAEERQRDVDDQMQLLGRFLHPDSTLIEIGPGDCALSIAACGRVRSVFAVDVSEEIARRSGLPPNFELHLSDGVSVPHPPGGADVVYSHQLMEHLHPEDALAQLRNIHAALAPGGLYLCVTPNRLTGPHDISRYFCEEARGFHLKEYSAGELLTLFRQAGFERPEVHALIHGGYRRVPALLVRWLEGLLEYSPAPLRRRLATLPPWRWFSTLSILARRSPGEAHG